MLIAAAVSVACATAPPVDPFQAQGAVWPSPPDEQRIAFVSEFRRSPDLGIRKGFVDILFGFAVGSNDDAMVRPMAVAATANSKIIFVADPDAQCVHRYDLTRGAYDCLTLGKNKQPVFPVGLDLADDGWLIVADSQTRRLLQLPPGGDRLELFYAGEKLQQPTGVRWDEPSQRLFVTDTGNQSVLVFDRQGNLKTSIGTRGGGPSQFNFPTYLWIDRANDDLLVSDSLNFRIQRFDNEGRFLHVFGENGDQPGSFSRPKGIATDTFGHVYVVDALMHTLQVFSADGVLLLVIGGQGQDPGQFWLPNGIYITSENMIFVADSYNKRVQVFRYVGPES